MTKLVNLSERVSMDKDKALETALSQIERNFGKGSIMKLGQDNPVIDIEAISTGSISLDIALGIGGLPKGRIIEIYGPVPYWDEAGYHTSDAAKRTVI